MELRKTPNLLIPLLLIWGSATDAWAYRAELVPGSPYTSGRGAAMGDAVLPLGDDVASGLFYNPAILARIRRLEVTPLNLGLQTNSDYVGHVTSKNAYKITSLSSTYPDLQRFSGYAPGVSGTILPAFGGRGFGVGVLFQERAWATSTKSGINYRSLYQMIPAAGFAVRLASGVIRLGYSGQYRTTAFGNVTKTANASLGYNNYLTQGSGISHNIGFALTLPWHYLPAFNFVGRNLGGTKYSSGGLYKFSPNPTGVPDREKMSFDASVSYTTKTGSGGAFNTVIEYRDALNSSSVTMMGRAALGMEFVFRDTFYLRGGWGSGYPCAGLAIKNKRTDISLSWFEEDIGSKYHELGDRRYMLQYTVRAF